ncbi:MAG: hypothetical protein NVS4B8_24720 [Herpetosiphon sp.]
MNGMVVLRRALSGVAGLALLAACASTQPNQVALKNAPTAAVPSNGAVAMINFQKGGTEYVGRPEFEQYRDKLGGQGIAEADALNEVVARHLLLHEAAAKDLVPDPAEVDTAVDKVKQQVCANPRFQSELPADAKQAAADPAKLLDVCSQFFGFGNAQGLRSYLSDQQLINKVLQANAASEEVHVAHILLLTGTPPKGTESDADRQKRDQEAEKRRPEIDAIYQELMANPAKFAEIANEKTEDPSGKGKGGDLGFVGAGKFVPEFEQVMYALKDGEISKPFRTQFGWHIAKRIEHRPSTQVSPQEAEAYRSSMLQKAVQSGEVKFLITPAPPPTPIPTVQTAPRTTAGARATAASPGTTATAQP